MTDEHKIIEFGGLEYKIPVYKVRIEDCKHHNPKDVYLMAYENADGFMAEIENPFLWGAQCVDCGTDYELSSVDAIRALQQGAPYRGQHEAFPLRMFSHMKGSLEARVEEPEKEQK